MVRYVISKDLHSRSDAIYSVDALLCAEFFVKLTPIGSAWYSIIETKMVKQYGANMYYNPALLPLSTSDLRNMVNTHIRKHDYDYGVVELEPHYLMKNNILKYMNKYQRYVNYVRSGKLGDMIGVNGVNITSTDSLIDNLVKSKDKYIQSIRDRPKYINSLGLEYNIGCVWDDLKLNPLNGDHRPIPLNLDSHNITQLYEISGYPSMFSSLTVCNVNLPQIVYDHLGRQRKKFYGMKSDLAHNCRYCELDFQPLDGRNCCSMFTICPICTVLCNKNFGRYKLLAIIATLREELFNKGAGSLFELMQAPTFLESRVKSNLAAWDEHYDDRFSNYTYNKKTLQQYSTKVWENVDPYNYSTIREYYNDLKRYELSKSHKHQIDKK